MKIEWQFSYKKKRQSGNDGWRFIVDEENRGRLLIFETDTLLQQLKIMVLEDCRIDHRIVNIEFNYYIPSEIVNKKNPHAIITNY